MRRFRTNDANVGKQTKKMVAISIAVAIPATAPGRALLGYAGRQVLVSINKVMMDPIGSMRRTDQLFKTYKRVGQAAALYQSLSKFRDYESSSSSTSSYQQYGGGGDNPTLPEAALALGYLGHQAIQMATEKSYPRHPAMPCRPGFVEKRVEGKLMCVRQQRK